ncbi:uncharacterized protein MONOS_300 [Monocercomonoides exilis]|uniref:uncharacterized protein n=1 Tax=Monocercomonoides exilis TaxID=2049356 RepID=UPI00355A0FA4|nr:hypothetical protein MONOS_300 [Monocercomonoides exilis]|eukprot:MONOS_300.1-p1 / transcript=MONOS_300.1 / gene=MONOS_300 / organism=Monocercomonoides_exilis_PA203 / gene_product=unspecified product / transcript_product=unspecified product / location=Mono_scaffold00005:75952-76929(+) / protein_length=326 / sequence_SO=supercontig / SO=protein_coding / is_pseudo=false
MNGVKFITFCFFDGNAATNGRGNDVFFSGSDITQFPFEKCGSTTPTQRVWNSNTADNETVNSSLPLISQNKIVSNSGTDVDGCGRPQQTPCATIEYALNGFISLLQDASLTLLTSTFVPTQTLTFSAVDTKITGNGTTATTIASSGIPQQPNSLSHSSQSTSSLSSFSSFSSISTSSSPDPSATSALFQQTQGSLTVSVLATSHNSTNEITPILFHLSQNSPSLNLNTTTIAEQPHLHHQSQPPSSSSLLAPSPSTAQQSLISPSTAKASSTSPPSHLPSLSTPPTSPTSPPLPPPLAVSSPLPPPLPSPSPSPTAPSPTSTQNS